MVVQSNMALEVHPDSSAVVNGILVPTSLRGDHTRRLRTRFFPGLPTPNKFDDFNRKLHEEFRSHLKICEGR